MLYLVDATDDDEYMLIRVHGLVDFKHGFVFAIFDSFAHKYELLKMKGSFGMNDKWEIYQICEDGTGPGWKFKYSFGETGSVLNRELWYIDTGTNTESRFCMFELKLQKLLLYNDPSC